MAKFKHPATVLRYRKDLDAVRDVGIERVESSNSEARFAFLSPFVNRKTAIDTLTATRGSNELDGANLKKGKTHTGGLQMKCMLHSKRIIGT